MPAANDLKTFIFETKAEAVHAAQEALNRFPEGSLVALAYNADTACLSTDGLKTVQVTEAGGLIAKARPFDVPTDAYAGEKLDACVLGLGTRGQIGFNEVATPFDTETHWQKLTDTTRAEYAFLGELPEKGLTLGIRQIVSAKKILVLALGAERAEAVFNMMYGRNDSTVPAAFLQISPDVDIYLDAEAAGKL